MAVLPDRGAERTGEGAGLQVRDPQLSVLGPPGRLVGLDEQPQPALVEAVPGGRALRRGPVREVVVDPAVGIETAGGEVVGEDQVEVGPSRQWHGSGWHYRAGPSRFQDLTVWT